MHSISSPTFQLEPSIEQMGGSFWRISETTGYRLNHAATILSINLTDTELETSDIERLKANDLLTLDGGAAGASLATKSAKIGLIDRSDLAGGDQFRLSNSCSHV